MSAGVVSAIIPAYNRAYCVEGAVDSVLAQTHRDVEVVVVDDGSTDDIAAVMARRYGGDARVKFVQRANGGIAAARNTGYAVATGAFIALLDSDDVWLPWKVEAQLACLARFGAGAAFSDITTIDARGSVTRERGLRALYHAWLRFDLDQIFDRSIPLAAVAAGAGPGEALVHAGDAYTASVVGNLICNSTLLMTRERMERVGPYDESLVGAGEDYEYNMRVCRFGPVTFLDVPTTLYRYGEADQATKRTLTLALHYVRGLEAEVARHRDRIRLSDDELRRTIANAYGWAGEELMAAGRGPESAAHYRRAVALGLRDVGTLARLALASSPGPLRRAALRAWYAAKGAVRRLGGASTAG